jgi:hypothetical protein
MAHRVAWQPNPSSSWEQRYTPETLRRIGAQVETLLSRHSNLQLYRRSIKRQLALIAAQIRAEDVLLLPRSVFLLLEMRGSGGVSAPLEQVARILGEAGYWKPPAHVQDYHRQDVYSLGQGAQRLFDEYAALDRRVKQLHAQLGCIKEHRHMKAETTPQEVFAGLAMAADGAEIQASVDVVVELLEQPYEHGWFGWPFVHRIGKKIQQVLFLTAWSF